MNQPIALLTHRWIVLEEPWLDDELILLAVAVGLLMGLSR